MQLAASPRARPSTCHHPPGSRGSATAAGDTDPVEGPLAGVPSAVSPHAPVQRPGEPARRCRLLLLRVVLVGRTPMGSAPMRSSLGWRRVPVLARDPTVLAWKPSRQQQQQQPVRTCSSPRTFRDPAARLAPSRGRTSLARSSCLRLGSRARTSSVAGSSAIARLRRCQCPVRLRAGASSNSRRKLSIPASDEEEEQDGP